jgi:tRNA(Ile)-lysidine synthase
MFEPGATVVVAVSGGVDSMVLLHVLRTLSSEFRLSLAIAHLDHAWRPDSAEDAAFVARAAETSELPLFLERVDEEDATDHEGLGREAHARELRRSFLARAAEFFNAQHVATGHTADDRAETILYNLTRGAGTAGLSGIDPVNGLFVRPLLSVGRGDILTYAQDEGLTWREDETNEDLSFARNRIRHRVLPELRRINPKAVEAVCRSGDHARASGVAESRLVSLLWGDVTRVEEPGEIALRRDQLAKLSQEVRLLLLREAFLRVRGDLEGINRGHVDSISDLIESCDGHAVMPLPRLHARIDEQTLYLSRAPFPGAPPWKARVDLGRTPFPDHGFTFDLQIAEERAEPNRADRDIEIADADRIAFPLDVRNRRTGDRFTPLGMDLPIKLKDFLIGEHVPYFDRDDVPLLCDRERILWVAGVRLSNDVRITDETRRFLVMRIEVDR